MVVKFIAIGFDGIRVVLNFASICRDVFLILGNLSILFVLLSLDGCKAAIHLISQLGIGICTSFGFCLIGIHAGIGFLLDTFSIVCNVCFIGSNASFMVVKFIAIGFDGIRVVLNFASICRDVFLILGNLSILFVLLSLDGCKAVSHLCIQLLIGICTGSHFSGDSFCVSVYATL